MSSIKALTRSATAINKHLAAHPIYPKHWQSFDGEYIEPDSNHGARESHLTNSFADEHNYFEEGWRD